MGLLDGILTGARQAKQSLGDISEYILTAGKGPRYWEAFNEQMRTNPDFANAVYMDAINKATPFMMPAPQKYLGLQNRIIQSRGIPELINKSNIISQGEPAIMQQARVWEPMGIMDIIKSLIVNPLETGTNLVTKLAKKPQKYILKQNRNDFGEYARGFSKFLE